MNIKVIKTVPLKEELWKDLNFSQEKVRDFSLDQFQGSNVASIGAGAIGSHVGLSLVRKGIGYLAIYDDDQVELKNLTRQLFSLKDVGKNKAVCLAQFLKKQGFFKTMIRPFPYRFQEALEFDHDFSHFDAIICAVDNNPTRVAVARYCLENNIPLIVSAVSRDGNIMSCAVQEPDKACLGCIMPHLINDDEYTCNLPGIIDIIQVVAGFTVYALDTILMNRHREWNLKTVFPDGSVPETSKLIEKRHDCQLCNGNQIGRHT